MLKNLKIRSKLGLGFGSIILVVLGISGVASYEFMQINRLIEQNVKTSSIKLEHAQKLDKYSLITGNNSVASIKMTREKDFQDMVVQINSSRSESALAEKELTTLSESGSFEEKQMISELVAQRKILSGKVNTAFKKRGIESVDEIDLFLQKELIPEWDKYKVDLDKVVDFYRKGINSSHEQVAIQSSYAIKMILTLLFFAMLLSGILAYRISHLIVENLNRALALSEKMASGIFRYHGQETFSKDETGILLSSMSQMETSMRDIVMEVREKSQNILNISDSLIAGNLNLSSRTEQQAASVEETAATMEELSSAISQNANNSQEAAKLSTKITNSAQEGVLLVKNVVDKMQLIKVSSDQISQITSLIDSIAFQTNILALNAAVEAARAGDHGRGFAVVASEVRLLSQKSSQAAKDIRGLIETSSTNINEGNVLAINVENKIKSMVNEFKAMNELIAQISHSTKEQSSGVSQIHEAISQIETVTLQNASLVEDAASSGENLLEQGRALESSVDQFQVI